MYNSLIPITSWKTPKKLINTCKMIVSGNSNRKMHHFPVTVSTSKEQFKLMLQILRNRTKG